MKALIAIGGNSLIRVGERGRIDEQLANAVATAKSIVRMIGQGWQIVVTHGNGPQAGAALLRSERAAAEVYTHTLDMCVATTQSEIGYILHRAFEQEMHRAKMSKMITTIPTMVRVDPHDPAFSKPTKPIGPFYSQHEAEDKQRSLGWNIVEDAARGWRRVVASPEPIEILQLSLIKKIMEMDILAIALGGGGIPVIVNKNGLIEGCEAVIDKDRSSALLAIGLGVDLFIISTDTDQVYQNYRKPGQQGIRQASTEEMMKYHAEGHFPSGSMGPKVESVVKFTITTEKKSIITSFEYLTEALAGDAGTHIVP